MVLTALHDEIEDIEHELEAMTLTERKLQRDHSSVKREIKALRGRLRTTPATRGRARNGARASRVCLHPLLLWMTLSET